MKLAEMSWPQVKAAAARAVAMLPVAAHEQHGPHLAVSTDAVMATELAERCERQLPDDLVLCPILPYGSSHHHLEFPGTMSLPVDLYTRVIVELVRSLLRGGFRKIIILNGHGGNVNPVGQALSLLSHEFDDKLGANIALATYWSLDAAPFKGAPPMETPALSHAGEYETSMMLHLFPERVDMSQARRSRRTPKNGYIGWEDDEKFRGVSMPKRMHFISDCGSSGEPQLATAAKGKHLLDKAEAALVEFVRQFKDWPPMPDLRPEAG